MFFTFRRSISNPWLVPRGLLPSATPACRTGAHTSAPDTSGKCDREAGGTKFRVRALRNRFNGVADRDPMLPASLTKRLVNHSRSQDVTEGCAADRTMKQLRDAAQRIADRIDSLIRDGMPLGAPA